MDEKQIADTILHDVVTAGLIAASIFVKNPNSQQRAANIIQAVNPLIAMLDQQLTAGTNPAPVATSASAGVSGQVA